MARGRTWHDSTGRLLVDSRDVASVEVAASGAARRKGLLERDGIAGAILLTPAASVHTMGMRLSIDVVFLDRGMRVIGVVTMAPGRLGLPRVRARHVLEMEAGRCAEWGLARGAQVTVG